MRMGCDHKSGPELIEMAGEYLRSGGTGTRFRWAENLTDSMWASVIVEVERRADQWIVTRLDRRSESLDEHETGFRSLS